MYNIAQCSEKIIEFSGIFQATAPGRGRQADIWTVNGSQYDVITEGKI